MFSGYITVNQTSQSKIFYVLYAAGGNINPNATVNASAPLILWLQGGPGCADFGSYFQMGPFNILWDSQGNPLPVPNGITWNEKYHMLFIDEPVGVGYSVCGGDLPRNSVENAYQLQSFITRFFEIYTSLKSQDFYILGDSYAGHFIPALATVMIQNYTQNGIRITGK
jgi:carboxypeptidase C (cathepsin A)